MASTYLSKTYGSAGNKQRQAISVWVKRAKLGDTQTIFWSNGGASYYAHLRFKSDDTIQYYAHNVCNLKTNRKFRDTNAWYHICVTLDTPQSTESDRLKIYVNGVAETSFSTATYPSQNAEVKFADDNIHYIGQSDSGSYFDGSMSHFHFVTNTAYAASTFGSTDSTTGEWKINTSPTVTYATNSFFILKDGNSGTDQSGQSNNYSVGGGTLTKTEDCPSNVFATLNPLVKDAGSVSYTSGNTKQFVDTANWRSSFSTLGMTTGKYYFEVLKNAGSNTMIGIRGVEQSDGGLSGSGNDWVGAVSTGWSLYNVDGVVKNNNSDVGSAIGTYADNDYIGCFIDCDNSKLYFSKNGTMLNTTGKSITAGLTYMFGVSGHTTARLSCNFGNGAFDNNQLTGTTYNGSDGNGIFKYNPNSITLDGSSKSFKSLSTKGLNA